MLGLSMKWKKKRTMHTLWFCGRISHQSGLVIVPTHTTSSPWGARLKRQGLHGQHRNALHHLYLQFVDASLQKLQKVCLKMERNQIPMFQKENDDAPNGLEIPYICSDKPTFEVANCCAGRDKGCPAKSCQIGSTKAQRSPRFQCSLSWELVSVARPGRHGTIKCLAPCLGPSSAHANLQH
jgi:hypothetical protein